MVSTVPGTVLIWTSQYFRRHCSGIFSGCHSPGMLPEVRGDVSTFSGVGDLSCAVLVGPRARQRFLEHFITLYSYSLQGSIFLFLVASCGSEGLCLCFQFPVCGSRYAINSQIGTEKLQVTWAKEAKIQAWDTSICYLKGHCCNVNEH